MDLGLASPSSTWEEAWDNHYKCKMWWNADGVKTYEDPYEVAAVEPAACRYKGPFTSSVKQKNMQEVKSMAKSHSTESSMTTRCPDPRIDRLVTPSDKQGIMCADAASELPMTESSASNTVDHPDDLSIAYSSESAESSIHSSTSASDNAVGSEVRPTDEDSEASDGASDSSGRKALLPIPRPPPTRCYLAATNGSGARRLADSWKRVLGNPLLYTVPKDAKRIDVHAAPCVTSPVIGQFHPDDFCFGFPAGAWIEISSASPQWFDRSSSDSYWVFLDTYFPMPPYSGVSPEPKLTAQWSQLTVDRCRTDCLKVHWPGLKITAAVYRATCRLFASPRESGGLLKRFLVSSCEPCITLDAPRHGEELHVLVEACVPSKTIGEPPLPLMGDHCCIIRQVSQDGLQEDGDEVVVNLQQDEKLGIYFFPSRDTVVILLTFAESPSARAGIGNYVGRRLTHVNAESVRSTQQAHDCFAKALKKPRPTSVTLTFANEDAWPSSLNETECSVLRAAASSHGITQQAWPSVCSIIGVNPAKTGPKEVCKVIKAAEAEEVRIFAEAVAEAEEERLAKEAAAKAEEDAPAAAKVEEQHVAAEAARAERRTVAVAKLERMAEEAAAAAKVEEERMVAEAVAKAEEEDRLAKEAAAKAEEEAAAASEAEEQRRAAETAAKAEEEAAAADKLEEERLAAETAAQMAEEPTAAAKAEEERMVAEAVANAEEEEHLAKEATAKAEEDAAAAAKADEPRLAAETARAERRTVTVAKLERMAEEAAAVAKAEEERMVAEAAARALKEHLADAAAAARAERRTAAIAKLERERLAADAGAKMVEEAATAEKAEEECMVAEAAANAEEDRLAKEAAAKAEQEAAAAAKAEEQHVAAEAARAERTNVAVAKLDRMAEEAAAAAKVEEELMVAEAVAKAEEEGRLAKEAAANAEEEAAAAAEAEEQRLAAEPAAKAEEEAAAADKLDEERLAPEAAINMAEEAAAAAKAEEERKVAEAVAKAEEEEHLAKEALAKAEEAAAAAAKAREERLASESPAKAEENVATDVKLEEGPYWTRYSDACSCWCPLRVLLASDHRSQAFGDSEVNDRKKGFHSR